MNILLIEPYFGGSHKAWAEGLQGHSDHNITLLTLPAQFWKWRMQGGAVTLARLYTAGDYHPDLILASDMFDLATFRGLTRQQTADIPIALYFHENQLTYPQNTRQKHGWQYGFINYASAMAADAIFFNSQYHLHAFYDELPRMLKHFGDYNELDSVDVLRAKSEVLSVGIDLRRFNRWRAGTHKTNDAPLIVWNHRWEEDKNPAGFLVVLDQLMAQEVPFRVAILGEPNRQKTPEFEAARERLGHRVVQYGYLEAFSDYARILWESDYVVSTAYQEFFGIAVVEAMYCGCIPILPQRCNYPYLVPETWHDVCIYRRDRPLSLLQRHLTGAIRVDASVLQHHAAQWDWKQITPQYDLVLNRVVAKQSC